MSQTKIWAHRGASGQAPENTLAAFKLAVTQGADGVELDVQQTADGVVVVAHDEDCRRVTGLPGSIQHLTLQELHQRNFSWYWPEFGWHALPTLEEVFDLLKPGNLSINIELKNNQVLYPGLEEKVLNQIKAQQMQDRVLISSFNHYSLLTVQKLCQEMKLSIPCGLLYDNGLVEPWIYARRIGAAAIHPHYANLRIPDFVEKSHAAGIAVHVWTVDQPDHQLAAFRLGVDALITNNPGQAREIRDQLPKEELP